MTEHFTYEGFDFTMEIVDDDREPPWEDSGYGVVSSRHGSNKRPGERVLHRDGNHFHYYDWQKTMAKAKREGWGHPEGAQWAKEHGLTQKQCIEAAVQWDFDRLQGWCDSKWRYVGVVVNYITESGRSERASLWGVESDDEDAIKDMRDELADQLLPFTEFERRMRKAVA